MSICFLQTGVVVERHFGTNFSSVERNERVDDAGWVMSVGVQEIATVSGSDAWVSVVCDHGHDDRRLVCHLLENIYPLFELVKIDDAMGTLTEAEKRDGRCQISLLGPCHGRHGRPFRALSSYRFGARGFVPLHGVYGFQRRPSLLQASPG
jgi:hypothetical protein